MGNLLENALKLSELHNYGLMFPNRVKKETHSGCTFGHGISQKRARLETSAKPLD